MEIVERSRRAGVSPGLILREEAQKAILGHLSSATFFSEGVFQGGTALRLFYQNSRFSEDLDFVFVRHDSPAFNGALAFLSGLENHLPQTIPAVSQASVRHQKDSSVLKRAIVRLVVPELPRQTQINLEFVNVPSYESRPLVAPFGPLYPVVRVESEAEILADKVVALAWHPYLKGRDLWDLHYLLALRGQTPEAHLVGSKLVDYGADPAEWLRRLKVILSELPERGPRILDEEMPRFLPPEVYPGYQALWGEFVALIRMRLDFLAQSEGI